VPVRLGRRAWPSDDTTGPGGLVSQLAGRVIETALGTELPEHPGYPPGESPPATTATVTRPGRSRASSGRCG
jgi:hypothetical protein